MTAVEASAPGKVVLSGEYAVLDGAPAIGMAVSRRATVKLTDAQGDSSRVFAPGYSDVEGQFKWAGNAVEWQTGKQEYRLFDSVLRAANIRFESSKNIVLDTRDFFDNATGKKTGIGSSAALTTALSAAITASDDCHELAQRAHVDFQAGFGSGVDIACSFHGGLIEFRKRGFDATRLPWPRGLYFRVLWSGVSANTAGKLSRLRDPDIGALNQSKSRLASAAEDMARVWRAGGAGPVLLKYRDYIDELRSFSADLDLGIFDAGHDELVDAAKASNLVYKPCGAGGGDVGIVFGQDIARVQSFASEHATKHRQLDCEIDFCGATLEVSALTEPEL